MTIRHLITGLTAAVALTAAADTVEYASWDFSQGLPDGFAVYDNDGAQLHFLVKQLGWTQGDSWRKRTDLLSGNSYMASPSLHSGADASKPADDWLVTPPVLIRGGNAQLTWMAQSFNEQFDDLSEYKLYVSDTAVTPADDWGEPVAYTDAPEGDWQICDLSLEPYVGKRVRFAWVNCSDGCELLGIDNITITGDEGLASVSLRPGAYALGGETCPIGAVFTASGDVPVTAVALTCELDGQTYTAHSDGLNLTAGQSVELWLNKQLAGSYGTTFEYTLTPSVNGIAYDPVACTTTMLAFKPERRVVLEEATGMWCGWCPTGIVAIDSLKMEYGDAVIPIAIHIVHDQDPLAMDAYAQAIGFSTAAPVGLFDRKALCSDPLKLMTYHGNTAYVMGYGGFGTYMKDRLPVPAMAQVELATTLNGRDLDVEVSSRVAIDVPKASYRLALVLIEDQVWKTGYYQTNYITYAGRGSVGGFVDRPSVIESDFTFEHVARMVVDNAYKGIAGSIPGALTAGETYTYKRTVNIPITVKPANASIVAMMIDTKTGEVLNAAYCRAGESTNAIDPVLTPSNGPKAVYNLNGIRVADTTDGLAPGIYLVRDGSTVTKTVIR